MRFCLLVLWLAVSCASATVNAAPLEELKPLETIELQSVGSGIKSLALDATGRRLAVLSSGYGRCPALVSSWDVRSGRRSWQVCVPVEPTQTAIEVSFSGSGRVTVRASLNTTNEIVPTFVTALNAQTGQIEAALRAEGPTIREVIAPRFGLRVRDVRTAARSGSLFAYSTYGEDGIRVVRDDPKGRLEIARLHEIFNDEGLLVFSPDGQQLAVGRYSGRISVWDLRSRQKRSNLRGHRTSPQTIIWSANGRRLLSMSERTVIAWDTARGAEISRYTALEPDRIQDISLQDSAETAVIGTVGSSMVVLDVATGRVAGRIGFTVQQQLYSADGQTLCVIAPDNRVRVYRRAQDRFAFDHETQLPGLLTGTALVHDGQLIVPVFGINNDSQVLVYTIGSRRLERIPSPQNDDQSRVIPTSTRGVYWIGSYSLNTQTARVQELRFMNSYFSNPRPDLGRLLSIGNMAENLTMTGIAEQNPVEFWTRPWVNIEPGSNARTPIWSPSGALLTAPWLERRIIVLDARTGKTKMLLRAVQNAANADFMPDHLAFSPNDKWLLAQCSFDTWCYFDLETRRQLSVPTAFRSALEAQFTPDGRALALTTLEGITLWGIPGQRAFGRN